MEFDIELVKLVLIATGAIFSTLSFVILLRSKLIRIKQWSNLTFADGDSPIAEITVVNLGERPVVIEAVRFPLLVWDDSPRLKVTGFMKFFRGMDFVFGQYSGSRYASDMVVEYSDSSSNMKLAHDEKLTSLINLEEMINCFFKYNETFALPLYFFTMVLTLKVEVHLSNGKIYRRHAHREIKWFMWKYFGNDRRLYQK
jgi:hypothetical protein